MLPRTITPAILAQRKRHLVPAPPHLARALVEERHHRGPRAQTRKRLARVFNQAVHVIEDRALIVAQQTPEGMSVGVLRWSREPASGKGAVDEEAEIECRGAAVPRVLQVPRVPHVPRVRRVSLPDRWPSGVDGRSWSAG